MGHSPSWSPDTEHIAFEQGGSIMVIDTFTGAVMTLLQHQSPGDSYSEPAWSPDGSKIAVTDTLPAVAGQTPESVISVFPATGLPPGATPAPLTQALTIGSQDSAPDWAPDGSKLVFAHQDRTTSPELMEVGAGGGATTAIPPGGDAWSDPGFSPDGAQFVATSHLHGVDIWTLNAGGPSGQVTHTDSAGHADWGVQAARVNTRVWADRLDRVRARPDRCESSRVRVDLRVERGAELRGGDLRPSSDCGQHDDGGERHRPVGSGVQRQRHLLRPAHHGQVHHRARVRLRHQHDGHVRAAAL
jgi:dipeptidyl aminopeptidase/acylaminoacyl peptidase